MRHAVESLPPWQFIADDADPVVADVVSRDIAPLDDGVVPGRQRGLTGVRQRVVGVEIEAARITSLEHHLRRIVGLLSQVRDHVDVRQQRILREPRPSRLHPSGPWLGQVDVLVEVEAIGTRRDVTKRDDIAAQLLLEKEIVLLGSSRLVVGDLLADLSFRMRWVVKHQRRRHV